MWRRRGCEGLRKKAEAENSKEIKDNARGKDKDKPGYRTKCYYGKEEENVAKSAE